MNLNELKRYVENTCKQPTNSLTDAFYSEHILIVYDYCNQLCNILDVNNVNKEIVLISALLHDISAVQDFKTLPTHNIDSAEIAEKLLLENKYPFEKIEKVRQCIENHVTHIKINEGSINDVILSNADAIAQIIKPVYWLFFSYKIRNFNFQDGKKWFSSRINSNWNSLIEPAKELIEDKYMIIKYLIQQ